MPDARTEILARIREQLGRADAPEAAETAQAYAAVPRAYVQHGFTDDEWRVRLLLERLIDYDAEILEAEEGSLAAIVEGVLRHNGDTVLLAPASIPAAWLPGMVEVLRDPDAGGHALKLDALTRASAVLTTCIGAIAETGTILLAHGDEQGRRVLSLLPDHHLCVLRRSQIVVTVSEGLTLIAEHKLSAITTVSGPSATADIEMTRIRGVHGPRRLTVLLLR
jgi:L-lactate dehydrogenase complex protein LldG